MEQKDSGFQLQKTASLKFEGSPQSFYIGSLESPWSSLPGRSPQEPNIVLEDRQEDECKPDQYISKSCGPGKANHLVTSRRLRQHDLQHKHSRIIKSFREDMPLEFGKKKHNTRNHLKNVLHLRKLAMLFHEKITCNSVFRKPVNFDPLENQGEELRGGYLCHIQKIPMPKVVEDIITVIKLLYLIVYLFGFPLSLLFDQVSQSELMIAMKALGICLCLLDILQILQTPYCSEEGQVTVQEVNKNIKSQRNSLLSQAFIVATIIASIVMTEFRLKTSTLMFIGMSANLKKYQSQVTKLENQLFTATHYEKYFDLVKVIAVNLLSSHFLACILIAITFLNFPQTWMTQAGITHAPWYQQYIWSYYFGTTIILTIGFGDIHAANYIQAFFIITISFFAIIFFGYYINYIGHLINSIRQDEVQKNDKLKVFGNLAKKTQVPLELKSEITNYIIQESQIKKVSNYAQEKQLIQELPSTLRSSFLQQSNKQLFNHLMQLVRFTKKTVQNLSENIQTKICHPQQLIKRAKSRPSLIILQSGEVGYATRTFVGSKLNNLVLQRIKNSNEQESKLVCADVLSNERITYDIKSLAYSVIYQLDQDAFEKSVAQSQQDFEVYRELRDRCKYKLSEYGVVVCKFCPNKKHTLFECPKLHFIPFRQTLPIRYFREKPAERQDRKQYFRNKKLSYHFKVTDHHSYSQNLTSQTQMEIEDMNHLNIKMFQTRTTFQNKSNTKESRTRRQKSTATRCSQIKTLQVVMQLRQEFKKLKKQEEKPEFVFGLWSNSDCDSAHDFTYYFPNHNPKKLQEKQTKATLELISKSVKRKLLRKQTTNYMLTTI